MFLELQAGCISLFPWTPEAAWEYEAKRGACSCVHLGNGGGDENLSPEQGADVESPTLRFTFSLQAVRHLRDDMVSVSPWLSCASSGGGELGGFVFLDNFTL